MEGTKLDYHHPIRTDLVENESTESPKSSTPILKKDSSFSSEEAKCNTYNGNESSPGMGMYKPKRFRNAWGNLSYANLIAGAILSSPKRKMKLNEIYAWFVKNVPYFAQREDETKSRGWKNSIRHNLSLKREFVRESGDKKAGYWYIDKEIFLQRLHSENRQINDPIYNRDMERFEMFVHRAFSDAEWNDRYILNPQQADYNDKNILFNGYNYQLINNFNDMNANIPNFPQSSNGFEQNHIDTNMINNPTENVHINPMGSFSNMDTNQQHLDISKQNPFNSNASSDMKNYTINQIGQNCNNIIPCTTKFMSSDGAKMDKYMVYATNNIVDPNRYTQLPQVIPQYQNICAENMDMQQLVFNANQNQYYAFSNLGFPLNNQCLRDQNFQPMFENEAGIPNLNINRQFTNQNTFVIKPNTISQTFPYQTGQNSEINKPLVN